MNSKPDLTSVYESHRGGRLAAPLAGAALLALAAAGPATAQGFGEGLFETGRVAPYTSNECVGLRKHECVVVRSERTAVGRGQAERIALRCPPGFPHLVGWDAKHNEHVSLTLVSEPPAPGARPARQPQTLEVAAVSHPFVDRRGFVVVYAGCSAEPLAGTAFARHRSAVPGNHVTFGQARAARSWGRPRSRPSWRSPPRRWPRGPRAPSKTSRANPSRTASCRCSHR